MSAAISTHLVTHYVCPAVKNASGLFLVQPLNGLGGWGSSVNGTHEVRQNFCPSNNPRIQFIYVFL